jgi:hypothetical protein
MKKTIYYCELIDGTQLICKTRTELSNKLKEWVDGKEGHFYLTIHQIDNILYNRIDKQNQKYIKKMGTCFLEDLFKTDNLELPRTLKNGKPLSNEYLRQLINKKRNQELSKCCKNPNLLNKNVFNYMIC